MDCEYIEKYFQRGFTAIMKSLICLLCPMGLYLEFTLEMIWNWRKLPAAFFRSNWKNLRSGSNVAVLIRWWRYRPVCMCTSLLHSYALRTCTHRIWELWLPYLIISTFHLIISTFCLKQSVFPVETNWRRRFFLCTCYTNRLCVRACVCACLSAQRFSSIIFGDDVAWRMTATWSRGDHFILILFLHCSRVNLLITLIESCTCLRLLWCYCGQRPQVICHSVTWQRATQLTCLVMNLTATSVLFDYFIF